jgi:hypothetical protein
MVMEIHEKNKMGKWVKWTKEMDEELTQFFVSSLAIDDICLKMSFTRKKILKRLVDLNLIKTKSNENNLFTIDCKYCKKEFTVPYRLRNREYCGRVCQTKAVLKTYIRSKSICKICSK